MCKLPSRLPHADPPSSRFGGAESCLRLLGGRYAPPPPPLLAGGGPEESPPRLHPPSSKNNLKIVECWHRTEFKFSSFKLFEGPIVTFQMFYELKSN